MPKQAYAKKNFPLMTLLIYVCLIAGAGTYFLPVIRVNLPPLGEKSWSVQDMVGPIFKKMAPSDTKTQSTKLDRDFFKIVGEVTPRDSKTSAPKKLSPTYIFGALVPVSLLVSYVFLITSLFLAGLKKTSPLVFSSAIAAVTSIYALLGTFYLGAAAERAFTNAVEKASEGILGVITKNFEVRLTVEPSAGLFLLVILMTLCFISSWYRENR